MKKEPGKGDVIYIKLGGRGIILKPLVDEADDPDPSIGKKYLVRRDDGKLVALYDCEFGIQPEAPVATY